MESVYEYGCRVLGVGPPDEGSSDTLIVIPRWTGVKIQVRFPMAEDNAAGILLVYHPRGFVEVNEKDG